MRDYELESAFELVTRRMNLRRPQLITLRKFHEAMKKLPKKLKDMDPAEAYGYFRDSFPDFPMSGKLELTAALATGVGKTRLIGAFIAYLHLADEASRFLILAPRTTIIDKIIRESVPGHPKYLFVDEFLVGEPNIIHAGNLQSYNPNQQRLAKGPEIWIFSPQSIAGSELLKFKSPTEFLGESPLNYLIQTRDLVAFFDESHYLGDDEKGRGVWMTELRNLNPILIIETTGSPQAGVNILHQYDIREALEEGLYIKDVEVFPKKRPASLTDDEWDRLTIRDGLKRLRIKEHAISRRSSDIGIVPTKPVMLVCAESKEHADEITEWIQGQLYPGEEAIAVHSGKNEEQYLNALLQVEHNNVKVVVHVFKLTEGWDVPNVYVIATLRALATVRGVIQTMGRGLRLPYGKRIGDEEVDSLDLLCYGSQNSQDIVDDLIRNGFGSSVTGRSVIGVREDPDESRSKEETKPVSYPVVRSRALRLHDAVLRPQKPQLAAIDLPSGVPERMRSIGLRNLEIRERGGSGDGLDRDRFRAIVVENVVRLCRNLGGLSDRAAVHDIVDRMLVQANLQNAEFIPIDIDMASRQIAESIKTATALIEPDYIVSGAPKEFVVGVLNCNVPASFSQPLSAASLTPTSWKRSQHAGIPVSGWTKSAHDAVPFDSAGELAAAKAIDRSGAVDWWARNLPGEFRLLTPVGNYHPDFLMVCRLQDGEQVLLEVKGEFLAVGAESEANLKAKAARAWCEAMTQNGVKWTYWLVLDRDAERCQTVEDLQDAAGS